MACAAIGRHNNDMAAVKHQQVQKEIYHHRNQNWIYLHDLSFFSSKVIR